ncbi:MAG TPA: WecB/TagA/CpsF family glycosyltransferase [Patescibacteria group bacterium]|nr:WecB/TagA/CpsF family glycosyltransferase [Patescibacteria group bacterium]
MHKVTILGVTIHDVSKEAAIQCLQQFLDSDTPHMIVTPNPEIVLHAHYSTAYQQALNTADLALPDGFGLRICSSIRHTVTGVDMAQELLSIANKRKLRIFCMVRKDGRSTKEQILAAIQRKAPHAVIFGSAIEKNQWNTINIIQHIQHLQPHILLVGLGFPEQELWLHQYLSDCSSVRIGMGIGGAFDFWTAVAKRAPQWIRTMGLEWFWRLWTEPHRIIRIIRAVILFPLMVLFNKVRRFKHYIFHYFKN